MLLNDYRLLKIQTSFKLTLFILIAIPVKSRKKVYIKNGHVLDRDKSITLDYWFETPVQIWSTHLIFAPMNYFEPNFLALSLIATNWRWTYKSWTTAQGSEKRDWERRRKKIQAQLLTLAQCDGVVRRVEIASELSIKVIFPKSGWQVWLNTLVVWSSSTIRTK